MLSQKVFKLRCTYQTYAWGKFGTSSEVARLLQSGHENFVPDEATTYAELWMGTHPKSPSVIEVTGESLDKWIQQHPESLGSRADTNSQLPFLFKVLSVNVALSIQVHPDKETAPKLRKSNPEHYGDDNHKPEMAIALSEFEALSGFRPKEEIVGFLEGVEELREIVGVERVSQLKNSSAQGQGQSLRDCFSALMTCDAATVQRQLSSLVARLENARLKNDTETLSSNLGDLVLKLHSQFPGDVGCFCAYFLNYIVLQPGQAIFLKANLPHAYLAGDCIECMACSDNVVRAGLTPKFKDVDTLCNILEYNCQAVTDILFANQLDPLDQFSTIYDPPIPEFSIAKIQLPSGVGTYRMVPVDGASIVIVLSGSATAENSTLEGNKMDIKRGSVFFIAANQSVSLTISSVQEGVSMYRAYAVL